MAWGNGAIGRGKEVEYREKMREALQMRKEGVTYPDIARKLGYADHSGARGLVEKGLSELTREPAEELRDLELSRLDDIIRGMYPRMKEGDHNAANAMVKAMDHRAKLTGLYNMQSDNGSADAVKVLAEFMNATIESANGERVNESD